MGSNALVGSLFSHWVTGQRERGWRTSLHFGKSIDLVVRASVLT
jgi:hypothetical protein